MNTNKGGITCFAFREYYKLHPSAQFWGESTWPAVVLKVWDTLIIHTSVACDHTGFFK